MDQRRVLGSGPAPLDTCRPLGDCYPMDARIPTYDEFWTHYLSEHRDPTSRRLHFVGTTGWMAACAGAAVAAPLTFPLAMAAFAGLAAHGTRHGEAERPALGHIAGMIALPALAAPARFLGGVVFAYGCAWAGHFGFEKNKPASFKYPLWSFVSDLRMWSHMVRGQLWSGDPLEELGLAAPGEAKVTEPVAADATYTNGAAVRA